MILRLQPLILSLLIVVLAGTDQLFGATSTWRIDTAHSSAQFSVRHMMISTVRGQFGGLKGAATYDPQNLASSAVQATIDCTTINTGEPKRDADLRSPRFFDVQRYPVMVFKSKRFEKAADGKLKIIGDLTINAVTREVILDVDGPSSPVRDNQGREKIGVGATTKISRKAFGIVYNPVLEGGGVTVSDEVDINLDIEMIKS